MTELVCPLVFRFCFYLLALGQVDRKSNGCHQIIDDACSKLEKDKPKVEKPEKSLEEKAAPTEIKDNAGIDQPAAEEFLVGDKVRLISRTKKLDGQTACVKAILKDNVKVVLDEGGDTKRVAPANLILLSRSAKGDGPDPKQAKADSAGEKPSHDLNSLLGNDILD